MLTPSTIHIVANLLKYNLYKPCVDLSGLYCQHLLLLPHKSDKKISASDF